MKRMMDVICSLGGLIVFFPLLFLIALVIKLEDRGPVFYRGARVGRYGRLFRIFKFRTMVVNAEKLGGPSTADDDPRITKIGKLLRKYKLDEVPQLINVLKGEMSLVGPRPEVPQEVNVYSQEEKALLSVRPGLTDYASIAFHNEGEILKGRADPHEAYRMLIRPEKIKLGLKYVRNRSLLTDFKILLKTFSTLMTTRLNQK